MNLNFNIGKNTNQINDTESKEENYEKVTTTSTNNNNKNNDMKKRMVKFMLIVCGGIIIILLIALLMSAFTKKEYSYTEIEEVLKEAAESYFEDHPDSLPEKEDQIVEIDSSNLVAEGKMETLSEYTGEDKTCSATVQVEKVSSEYLYTPYLNCGNDYTTEQLYQKVLSQNQIVISGYGLYNEGGIYRFRGEKVNNYVKLDKVLWRIVKITADNNIVLISKDDVDYPTVWDDRYNKEFGYTTGINNYSSSRIKETLESLYNKKSSSESAFLSSNDKKNIISHNACTGKRTLAQTGTDNAIECSSVEKAKVSLLTLSDYMASSIDADCVNAESAACQNYNYLATDYDWWLITAVNGVSNESLSVNNHGEIEILNSSNSSGIRPVIYLNSKTLVKDGKGTKSKPYTIK